MNYIDFAIASSLFIIFFGVALIFSTNYFSNLSSLTKTSEFRSTSENFFKIFESKGLPENWDDYSITPVKIGLAEDLYMASILVRETNASSRTNEPVTAQINFDDNCQNKSWNNTVRMYDEDWNQINIEISNTTFCNNQYLNQSNITWNINISADQNKKYYLYFSPDDEILNPNYASLIYDTSSWKPSDRDAWTETTANWTLHLASQSTGIITNDTVNKIRGNSSVNVTGTFSYNNILGLQFLALGSSDDLSGISNDWYIDFWIYVDNKTGLDHLYIQIIGNPSYPSVMEDIYNDISDSSWYHFVKPLDYNQWDSHNIPDFSNGINFMRFYMTNTTPNLIRTLKIDGLYLKKKPLEVQTFPEEKITAVSGTKLNALKNTNYDEIRKTIGGNYKFRLEVGNESYGGNINISSNVGCSEYPKIIEYNNGTVSKTEAKMCVWK